MTFKHILLLGMGGTIAGLARDPSKPLAYQAAQIPVSGLIEDLELDLDFGEIESVQVANIDSRNMTEELLIKLGWAVKEGLEREDISGIVITHGTDTMEEVGVFLHATLGKLAPGGLAVLPTVISVMPGLRKISQAPLTYCKRLPQKPGTIATHAGTVPRLASGKG